VIYILSGIDGMGMGLFMHHQALGRYDTKTNCVKMHGPHFLFLAGTVFTKPWTLMILVRLLL
jgi:hypothetical protein